MHMGRDASRICTIVVLSAVASACAAHTSPSAFPHPAPFPSAGSTASNKPDSASGPALGAPSALIQTALGLEGVPYQWGGDQPSTGFDCSGFVQYVLGQHNILAPRTAAEQFLIGKQVELEQVRAGDLVFFSTVAPGASHVGLAVSSEEFVHAPAANGVVRVERVRSSYWLARFVGARRVF